MQTTLDIDEELLSKVIHLTGEKRKSRAVNRALEDYLYWEAIRGLRALTDKIDLGDNLNELEESELREQKRLYGDH